LLAPLFPVDLRFCPIDVALCMLLARFNMNLRVLKRGRKQFSELLNLAS
jgi:hypothetical protein